VDRRTVLRWINGQVRSIPPERARDLAQVLGCRLEDLLLHEAGRELASEQDQRAAGLALATSTLLDRLGPVGEWDVIEQLIKASAVPDLPVHVLGRLYHQLSVACWRQDKLAEAATHNQAALTLAKTRAASLGLDPASFEKVNVHVHVPAGAIPKDGPSAGVAMFIALASLFAERPVRNDTAMTGEISLRGLVLPVGGIKDKVLAAMRAGIQRVMLPARNRRDLEEVPAEAKEKLEFIFLENVDDAVRNAMPR